MWLCFCFCCWFVQWIVWKYILCIEPYCTVCSGNYALKYKLCSLFRKNFPNSNAFMGNLLFKWTTDFDQKVACNFRLQLLGNYIEHIWFLNLFNWMLLSLGVVDCICIIMTMYFNDLSAKNRRIPIKCVRFFKFHMHRERHIVSVIKCSPSKINNGKKLVKIYWRFLFLQWGTHVHTYSVTFHFSFHLTILDIKNPLEL